MMTTAAQRAHRADDVAEAKERDHSEAQEAEKTRTADLKHAHDAQDAHLLNLPWRFSRVEAAKPVVTVSLFPPGLPEKHWMGVQAASINRSGDGSLDFEWFDQHAKDEKGLPAPGLRKVTIYGSYSIVAAALPVEKK